VLKSHCIYYKKGDKTDCSNYSGISLLPTTYKILSNILRSRLTAYAEEIVGVHQFGLWCNRSTALKFFICPTNAHNSYKIVKLLKSFKIIIVAPTCFGLHKPSSGSSQPVLRWSYNVDIGYISLFEVIGIVAAYFVQSAMMGPSLIFRVKLGLRRST